MGLLNRGDEQKSPLVEEIEKDEPYDGEDASLFTFPDTFDNVVSSGSLLLDLAISGNRIKGGGIPGGIVMEIFGKSSSGKTQLMGEICASVQAKGGKVKLGDPEAKFDPEYAAHYGFHIDENVIYMPDTPADIYREIFKFKPSGNGIIDCVATDSIAALIASAEVEQEKDPDKEKKKKKSKEGEDNKEESLIADKMGGMKPKEMHALLRKIARRNRRNNTIAIFTNQLHDSMSSYGSKSRTPGGYAVPYFAALRIEIKKVEDIEEKIGFVREIPDKDGKPIKKRKEHEKIIGINSTAITVKNHIDDAYRTAPLRIIFRHGFDDVGANLQWLKDVLALNTYEAVDKSFTALNDARLYVEEHNKEPFLRDMVIHYWYEIENKFRNKLKYKPRVR